MDKVCLIYQPCGIGDIFYSIGIARYYQKLGYRVIWPVIKELTYLKEYIPNIEFCSEEENFPKKEYYISSSSLFIYTEDFIFLPIHRSTEVVKGLTMPSKYEASKIYNDIWKENFIWNRNVEKENKLYYDVLGLKENEDYIFINQNFITIPRTVKFPMNIEINDNKIIVMDYIEGYTVFDWAKVIEKAKGIITIDTCILFMIDILKCDSEYFYCYTRNGMDTYKELKDIFQTQWIWLDSNNNKLN
jgi:hypothetical protein